MQFYRVNGFRVLTVIVSAKRAASDDKGRHSWLVTRACQNIKATLFLLPIFLRQIVCGCNI